MTASTNRDFVIPAPPRPQVPVLGGGAFPLRRVYCVGRNYAAHAREMGGDPEREPPFFFLKPADCVWPVGEGETGHFIYPPQSQDVHHEVELVVALAAGGRDLSIDAARASIFGYAVGLDMTRRDLQAVAKAQGRPWEIGKVFAQAAPLSAIRPLPGVELRQGRIALYVDGELRQQGDLADMIWSVAETIAYFSRYDRLEAGDLIFTGTPSGVGPVLPGQRLEAAIEGVGTLVVQVGDQAAAA